MGNFDINTNFNLISSMKGFDNSIADFNKTFFNPEKTKGNESNINFNDILNSFNVETKIPDNNFEAIETVKPKEISASEKMANDIGAGFKNGINELNAVNRKAERDFETFASGGDISIHEVMISAQKSNLTMQMAMQLRNQILNAYNEFKGMQL